MNKADKKMPNLVEKGASKFYFEPCRFSWQFNPEQFKALPLTCQLMQIKQKGNAYLLDKGEC